MITQMIPITGTIREIRDGRIYTSSGDHRDCYNERYYRPAPSHVVQLKKKNQTFANLLKLALETQSYRARDVYTRQYLSMAHRRMTKLQKEKAP